MSADEFIVVLEELKGRIHEDVIPSYSNRGRTFGRQRWESWQKKAIQTFDEWLPTHTDGLRAQFRHIAFVIRRDETPVQRFMREDGERVLAYIDSLILDVQAGDVHVPAGGGPPVGFFAKVRPAPESDAPNGGSEMSAQRVFIVHGHDEATRDKVQLFVKDVGFEPIVLFKQASKGKTIIEKVEEHTDVDFAIVLYTPDDVGSAKGKDLRPRARQNVVFEHGYLMARLGRGNVVFLVTDQEIEVPSDIGGLVYLAGDWQKSIAKEMHSAGLKIDVEKFFAS